MAPQHQYMDFMEINRPLAGRLAMARKKDIPRLKFAEDRLFYKYFEVFGDRKYEVTDTRHVALDRSAAARFVARQMELMNEGQSEADAFAKTAEEMETDRQVQHAQYHFSADYVRRGDPPAPPRHAAPRSPAGDTPSSRSLRSSLGSRAPRTTSSPPPSARTCIRW